VPTGKCRLEIAMQGCRFTSGPYRRSLPTAVAASRLAGLLHEATLVVTRLLGDQRAAVGAGLAVKLAGAGRVVGVCHSVLILVPAILFNRRQNTPGARYT